MGYYLQAFICQHPDGNILPAQFSKAVQIELKQGVSLIPLTDALINQIVGQRPSVLINKFECFTDIIEQEVLSLMGMRRFAYVEAFYWGGEGAQHGIIWREGKREQELPYEQDQINAVLKYFGVVATDGDEFQTLGFGRHRNTREWV